jgi:hypothetical protein
LRLQQGIPIAMRSRHQPAFSHRTRKSVGRPPAFRSRIFGVGLVPENRKHPVGSQVLLFLPVCNFSVLWPSLFLTREVKPPTLSPRGANKAGGARERSDIRMAGQTLLCATTKQVPSTFKRSKQGLHVALSSSASWRKPSRAHNYLWSLRQF